MCPSSPASTLFGFCCCWFGQALMWRLFLGFLNILTTTVSASGRKSQSFLTLYVWTELCYYCRMCILSHPTPRCSWRSRHHRSHRPWIIFDFFCGWPQPTGTVNRTDLHALVGRSPSTLSTLCPSLPVLRTVSINTMYHPEVQVRYCTSSVTDTAVFMEWRPQVVLVGKLRLSHETHSFWKAHHGPPMFSSSFYHDNDSFRRDRHYSTPPSKLKHR
jgi:hypothetical protein